MISNYKKEKGFTLVEMMVAIAVFSVVMVTAMSALLNVIDANNKARAIKTAINNISLALEGISKDMRVGSDYVCSHDEGTSYDEDDSDCSGGGKAIMYRSPRAYVDGAGERGFAYYKFEGTQIKECLQDTNSNECLSDNEFLPITSSEVIIDSEKSFFYVLNTEDSLKQPRMILTISGEAGSKDKIKTQFDLQTGVSQRIRPE